ncbi:MAG TPA: hypothetical protein VK925_11725 [Jiangellaceae bacterium]|nr:hypothetical protein [Jiangellaceae bacterium]
MPGSLKPTTPRSSRFGADRTVELARAQYESLRRLATLPDETAGLADARSGIVLLGPRRRGPDVDDRPGEAGQLTAVGP